MKLSVIPKPNKARFKPGVYSYQDPETILLQQKVDISLGEEAYRLQVNVDRIVITASSEKGFYYARQTLRQMVDTANENKLPCCEIEDAPVFAFRGFMIDCARHFVPVDDLKKMIDVCAKIKMNTFHWHLTDDQGWRVQLDCYPELTEKGSTRPYSDFGRYMEPGEHAGYYTKAEIREIIDYCAERFIQVIPEIEMPGHASSLLSAFPQLSCNREPVRVKTRGGIYEDTLCIGNPKTEKFLCEILDEVAALFPCQFIHLGGDEAPKFHWRACPKCQAVIQKEHLKDEAELQCWFTNRMADHLNKKGKSAIVWNDAMKGGYIHPNITVQYWTGGSELSSQHVNAGGKMIVSEFFHYYLDYSYGQTPLDKTYTYNPVPDGIQAGRLKDVIGIEAPIWTEYVPDLEKMSFLCFPRLLAVAETGWTQPERKDTEDFHNRIKRFIPVLKQHGLNPAGEEYWNMSPVGRVKSLAEFWYHATTWKDIKANIDRFQKERKEEQRE